MKRPIASYQEAGWASDDINCKQLFDLLLLFILIPLPSLFRGWGGICSEKCLQPIEKPHRYHPW